ncbi:unnamed protein product [Rotaria sp. Silwood1]|nr:unnamed protein product [Rotaria sp. Silwood1]
MTKNQFYIFLSCATTVTSFIILRYYFQERKKKKQNEEQKKEYLKCRSLFDIEQLAKKLMKTHRFYYYDYKAGQGYTYQASRDYFDKQLQILPRVLIDVTQISLKTNIFGSTYESPIIIAPSTFHCLAHIDGEVATARGATEAECIYTYNWMYSTMPEEKVLQTTGPKFLHVYLTTPIELLERIVSQAENKGYRSIVVTCDHPTDQASKTIDPELMKSMPMANMNVSNIIVKQNLKTGSITWTNIESLKRLTKLPIICKGILSTIDAELAIKHGADGILVSNHGGRQVDTAPPAIQCLQDIVNVVNGRAQIFVDTGIRTGTDVLKALALGAQAVFIGRPALYGLACGGHDGVKTVLNILKRELTYDMASCGITSIDQINKDILYKHT